MLTNTLNIALLTQYLLQCEAIIPNQNPDISIAHLVTEAFRSAVNRKHLISTPTLPVDAFYEGILHGISQVVPEWRCVPAIVGILAAQKTQSSSVIIRVESLLKTRLVQSVVETLRLNTGNTDLEIVTILLLGLGLTFPNLPDSEKKRLPVVRLLPEALELVFFSKYGLQSVLDIKSQDNVSLDLKFQSPVISGLNSLSYLIQYCISRLKNDIKLLDFTTSKLLKFTSNIGDIYKTAVKNQPGIDKNEKYWKLLKLAVFSLTVVYQGIISVSLHSATNLLYNSFPGIYFKNLRSLFNIHFIVDNIGTAGFSAYNFVYFTSLDGIFETSIPESENLARLLVSECNLGKIDDEVERGKILFTLDYYEHLVQISSQEVVDNLILPFTNKYLNPIENLNSDTIRPILESAHSVVLASLSSPSNAAANAKFIPTYTQAVLNLFPSILSADQFILAIESIAKAVYPPSPIFQINSRLGSMLMAILYKKADETDPNILLPALPSSTSPTSRGEKVNSDEDLPQPPTVRTTILAALINVICYVNARDVKPWLDKAWNLVHQRNEKDFIKGELWRTISGKFDMHRANIGIKWWYENIDYPSKF